MIDILPCRGNQQAYRTKQVHIAGEQEVDPAEDRSLGESEACRDALEKSIALDEVVRARDHLRAAGATITFEGRRRAGCQVAVEFRDPDGHRLEIYWGLDQVGADGNIRPPEQWREAHSLKAAIDDPEVDTIYLLSDGVPSYGSVKRDYRVLQEVARANRWRKVVIHTILLGTRGTDKKFMRRLAEQTGGTAVDAEGRPLG